MANPASPWNASHSYVPLCATTDGPVGGLSATGPARRVLIRLPDLSAVIANQATVAPVGLLGEKASLDVAPAASAPYSPSDLAQFESIGVDARRDDKSSQLTEQLEHATLRAALVRMFVAHLSQLARHPRTLAAGLLVAVAQFFLLMLVNGRLTISEPTFFRLVRAGKIHKSQIGPNVVRYTLAELDRYIASVTSTAEGITE